MFRLLLLILFVLAEFNLAFAQDKNRRRQEQADEAEIAKVDAQLKFYAEELEKVKVKRWQDKRNGIARKEAFAEAWEDIRREMEQLNQKKAQQEASLLRLDNQIQQMESELKALEDRQKEFGIQISEKASELVRTIQSGFPHQNEPAIHGLKKIQTDLEARGFRANADLIQTLFSKQQERFLIGETREISREQFTLERISPENPAEGSKRPVPKTAGVVAGYFVRLGSTYKAFISTETPDAAILAKSGSLGSQPWVWLESIPPSIKNKLQLTKGQILNGDSTTTIILPIDVILRKATGSGFSAEEEKSTWESLKEEWIGAGFVIWFLLAIEIVALLIISDKLYLGLFRILGGKRIFYKLKKLISEGKIEEAKAYAAKKRSSVAKVLSAILDKSYSRQEAEEAAHAAMLHEQPILERNINTINILSAAAPLVGLLGTVSGMINLFSAITMHGTNDPKIMAAGIAEALLATKWALIVALPLMLIFNITQNVMGKAVTDMEKYAASLLNQLFESKPHA